MPDDGIDALIIRWLQGVATPEELETLRAWRRFSPERQEYCRELARTWQLTGSPPGDTARAAVPSADAILARSARATRRQRLRRVGAALVWGGLAAASLTVAVLGVQWVRHRERRVMVAAREFRTGAEDLATVTLDDGSVVRLGPSSVLQVEHDTTARVMFLSGRAFFSVVHKPGVAFRVRTDAGEVAVTGTRFAVTTHGRSMRTVVLQGTVAAIAGDHQEMVHSGELGDIQDGAAPSVAPVADPFGAIDAWVGDLVSFEATPLDEVARELARHFHTRVTLSTPKLASRTVTASFTGWTLPRVLSSVCAVADVKCTTSPTGVVISPQ